MLLRTFAPLLFAAFTVAVAQQPVQDKPVPLSQPRPSAAAVAKWQNRKFGMFIHFGLYSQLGGMWQGRKIDNGYSEQIMANAPIPLDEYAATAKTFDPVHWDPDAVVALAKAAGMRYIVITSKHHDGFNMFHTAQSRYNVVDATPYHRDVVKELADACARGGIAFGVYYSSIDWHEPGMDHYIEGNSNLISDAHARFNDAQLHELMTGYGPLSEIWFDMGKPAPEQSKLFATTVHTLQPDTMVSGRVWNYEGDFTVMGDNEVPSYGIDEPWQTPASMFHETWGYRSWQQRDDLPGKVHENILKLVQVVSRGGNYILNIGPEGDGSIVPYEADVLHGVGAWLKPNAAAIYGTTASPFAKLDFGYATQKPGVVYLFVQSVPAGGALRLPHSARTVWKSARLLGSHTPLTISTDGGDTLIAAPSRLEGFLPVIEVKLAGPVQIDPTLPVAASDGLIHLDDASAEKFYNYNGRGYEVPKTLYKMRWSVPSGCANATFHTQGSGYVSVVANGSERRILLHGGAMLPLVIGKDETLEITPPEPFVKGTQLAVKDLSVDLSPQPCR